MARYARQERRIMLLISQGHSNKEIAARLNLRESSVKVYVSRIYIKYKVSSRAELMVKMVSPVLNPFVQES